MGSFSIPDGYRVEQTDERVSTVGARFFRFRAAGLAKKHPPIIGSYHLRIEKTGFLRYEVVAYQNKLVPVVPPPGDTVEGFGLERK